MSNDIRQLLQKISDISEGEITPVAVKKGLNPQQKSADQLPALFRPHKIRALGAKTDPQHPMKGMAVGASESVLGKALISAALANRGMPADQARDAGNSWSNVSERGLAETMAGIEEDLLSKVKKDLNTYLDKLGDKTADDGRRDLDRRYLDQLSKKKKIDRDLVSKAKSGVEKGNVEETPAPAHVMALEDGSVLEIHGSDEHGYEIRRGERRMTSRFPNLDHARMAVDLFRARQGAQSDDRDYVDEK